MILPGLLPCITVHVIAQENVTGENVALKPLNVMGILNQSLVLKEKQ